MNTEIEPRFLSIENVLQAHDFSIERTGGSPGVRDLGLLQSALMMPQQQFSGYFLHEGFAGKAAAYLYHIAANHPFIDGNKRTATLAALAFLDINGVESLPDPESSWSGDVGDCRRLHDQSGTCRVVRRANRRAIAACRQTRSRVGSVSPAA